MMPPDAQPASDLAPTAPVVPPPSPRPRASPIRTLKLGVWARARFILVGSATHIVEFGNGLLLLTWGLWLALPLRTFDTDPLLYRAMANLMPEWAWGAAALVVGTGSIWILLTDGRVGRARMSLLQFLVWLFVCLFIGQATGFRSTAVPIYGCLALGAGWTYVRLERDKRRPG